MVTQIVGDVYASGNGTNLTTQLQYPASIAAGDKIYLFLCHNNGTALSGVGASGTGVFVPAGFTQVDLDPGTGGTNDHVNSAATAIRGWTKTGAVTDTGGIATAWGGGSGGSTSRTFWAVVVFPAAYTVQGFDWTDNASLTNATITQATYSHTGADVCAELAFVKGSTDFTSFTTTPADTAGTLVEAMFGSGGSACSGGLVVNNTPDRDGTVGAGTWVTSSAASAARCSLIFVATLPRVAKSTSTTWQTRARVAKTQATTWDARARVAKTLSTTWSVRARVAKTIATTWDVAGTLSRITKSIATTWQTRARVAKTQATTWDVAGTATRVTKTVSTTWQTRARVAKSTATTWTTRARLAKTQATTWNLASMLSEASWPAFMSHRGGDPGPEETMFAYDASWAKNNNFWHEMDAQTLNDGVTMVANHDDDVDRMYSSGPVATGLVSSISPTNWDLEFWRVNTGYTGAARAAMRISAWATKYGRNTATQACGLVELKAGNSMADLVAALGGCQGSVVIECSTLADCDAGIAAGYDVAYWRPAANPVFSEFTSHGIKYLVMDYNDMTGTIASNAIAAGVKVILYTVNSTANRDAMLALFSDDAYVGFLSNKPLTIAGTTRVAKTTSTTWQTRARVAKSTATTWTTRARAAKTQATSWDTRARLSKTQATTWQTRARVAKSTSTTWTTRARVVKSIATSWDTAGTLARVTKTQATTWTTRARVAKTSTTSWDTRARLAKSTATTWQTRARAAKTQSTTWSIRARVAKTCTATWTTRQRVAKTCTATWDTRARANLTCSTTWETRARVTALRSTSWHTRERVVATRQTTWNVLFDVPVGDGVAVDDPRLALILPVAGMALTMGRVGQVGITNDQPTLALTGVT